MHIDLSNGAAFEKEVRNIARQLWLAAAYTGPIVLDGRERDGVFVSEENIHCIEATISRNASKAEQDLSKINILVTKLRRQHPDKAVKGWFITKDEPTGEQGTKIEKYSGRITHQTYLQFYAKLVDSKTYLNCRKSYPFGSARNIENDTLFFPVGEYIQSTIYETDYRTSIDFSGVVKQLTRDARRFLITGEYGVGKSMFLREVFLRLASAHEKGQDSAFPVFINLSAHIEQYDPSECLMRHGTKVGFANPNHLVRAWRSGYVYLLLDGFDELTPRMATRDAKRAKDVRRGALELVKRFVRDTPRRAGLIVTGRSNFFDNQQDLRESISYDDKWLSYSISDFDEKQTAAYLHKKGYTNVLPTWVPRRPLLIGYLLSKQLLFNDPVENFQTQSIGWDYLIDKICEREINKCILL